MAKYLSIALGVAAVLMTVAGLLGGRLIGLECSAVIQLTFLCLLTLEDLSPSLDNLTYLGYSFGFNAIKAYDLGQNVGRPYKSSKINAQFVYNYNIMAAMVAIPAIVAIVCRVASSRAGTPERKRTWMRRAKWAVG